MVNPILPKAQSHISETSRQPSREWYEFFRRLLEFIQESGADPGVIASILQRLDELEEDDGSFLINGLMSINVAGTPDAGVVNISLDGDVELPGNTYYYGTGPTGTKGFFTVASAISAGAGITKTVAGTGVTTIAHADTSSVANLTSDNSGAVVLQDITFTFDTFGHVQTATVGTVNLNGGQITHNTLGGLQGGTAGEYYHLTAAQYASAVPILAGGTTAQFLRGDLTWTNTLLGPLVLQTPTTPDITMQLAATPVVNQSVFGINGGDASTTQATINFRANENWGVSAKGTRIDFRTTPIGSTTLTMAATIQNIGAGFGTTTPNYAGFTTGVTVEGSTNSCFELSSTRADANDVVIGALTANYRTNSAGHQRIADVQFQTDGTTANQRGGRIAFWTKPNASATLMRRWNITQTGDLFPELTSTYVIGSDTQRVLRLTTRDLVVGPNNASFGGGVGVINLGNATTNPTTNPTSGVVMYAEAGAAKVRGASGTVTTFGPAAPHCPECGSDFVHEWENTTRGYGYLAVCMNCFVDGVNSHTRVKGDWTE